ncbi:hypothetical protein MMC25_008202 [Agyrium rufum]|nr:hypothetical protein [Agyrium rufum]
MAEPGGPEPVAVVGLSFRLGGGAEDADSFWDMLLAGRCAASDVPSNRFDANSFYHPDTNQLDTLPIRQAHFLQGDVSTFDAPFFSIAAQEAAATDPQSRLLLETSYRALENGTAWSIWLFKASSQLNRTCVVGGVNLFLTPESIAPLAHLNFFSPDYRCFSFDQRANGYSRGKGVGVVVLKRLSSALKDGDTIRAVIRSTGSNENGRSAGAIMQVSKVAQETLMRDTYAKTNLDCHHTMYVEAHAPGTGGDEIKAATLASVFRDSHQRKDSVCLGSVKANLGHLEDGSGIASLIKTIFVLERDIMPRLANFENVNPKIPSQGWMLKVYRS